MRMNKVNGLTLTFSVDFILSFIIVTPYLLPYMVRTELLPSSVVFGIEFMSIILMVLYIIINIRVIHYCIQETMIILVMFALLIHTTYVNNGGVVTAGYKSVQIVCACLFLCTIVYRKEYVKWFLCAVKYYTFLFCILHIVLMMVYPLGIPSFTVGKLAPHYLYGNVNATIKYLFPGMLCSSLIDYKNEKISLTSIVLWFSVLYQFVCIYHSATSLVALLYISVWLILYKIIVERLRTVYLVSIVVIFALELLIVVMSNTNVIGFIVGLFGKSGDFSGRAFLWQRITSLIRLNPIFGVGLQSANQIKYSIGNSSGSHNYYLDMVYQQGFIGLGVFLLFVLQPLIYINKNRISIATYVVLGFCIGYLIMFLTEPFFGHEITFLPIFFIASVLCKYKVPQYD